MRPLPFNAISKAVQNVLRRDVRFDQVKYIERSPLLNEDTSKCPWIGIYRDNSEFTIRTIGMGAGARYQHSNAVIIIQCANATGGDDTEDELEQLVADSLDALFSDPSLGNGNNGVALVNTINLSKVQYRIIQVQEDDYFQQAEIHIQFETTTR